MQATSLEYFTLQTVMVYPLILNLSIQVLPRWLIG